MDWWNGGMVEWWNDGWNGGMAEWLNGGNGGRNGRMEWLDGRY